MVTMTEVAAHAGVSTATVSRVINRPTVVDEATRDLVQRSIEALSYRPNAMARGLAMRSSRTVGVVINLFGSPYYGAMLDGVVAALDDAGYKALAESSRESAHGERTAWLSLIDRQCEATIVHSDKMDDAELASWMKRHPASVLMNRRLDGFGDRCVHLDNARGAEFAVRHLLERGHRRIATIRGIESYHEAVDRTRGFEKALREAGIDPESCPVEHGGFTEEGGRAAMERLLDRASGDEKKTFTAVFFQNDEMAAGGIEACRAMGLSVPDDISIIGFDDHVIARHLTPSLTTVRQPLAEIGHAAGRLAHAVARDMPTDDIPRIFEATLIERASVADITGSQEEEERT